MCSIIGVGERLHKVLGQIGLAHWTQVSDRCPLGYLFQKQFGYISMRPSSHRDTLQQIPSGSSLTTEITFNGIIRNAKTLNIHCQKTKTDLSAGHSTMPLSPSVSLLPQPLSAPTILLTLVTILRSDKNSSNNVFEYVKCFSDAILTANEIFD